MTLMKDDQNASTGQVWETIEHEISIPLRDGISLSGRVWRPANSDHSAVPAILEYLPYRKSDATAYRDAQIHGYFARHGYAGVRIDLRGSGDSDGVLHDEYLPEEQQDGIEAIAWLSQQPWCSGKVGMIGISWGGFNGLQIAAHRPPELAALISVCSTDDRFADDVHYMGGCVLACDMLEWATSMLAYTARPPDPSVVGEKWRQMWTQRLDTLEPFIHRWLAHQRRDDYWKQGSVCEDYSALSCPVYMVGGWQDPYRDAILRFLSGYPGPKKGLIGPWAHSYPHEGAPGPAIGFLQECLRWWDYWLKDIDNGIMNEPALQAWMQYWVYPQAQYRERPGRWVTEGCWPPETADHRRWYLGDHTLDAGRSNPAILTIGSDERVGRDAGTWCAYGRPADLPPEQSQEDGLSLTFESAPISEPLEIMGFPWVNAEIASDRPIAHLAVRLCDVAPSGQALLVTRGLLNLTHRDSHESPSPLQPGQIYEVGMQLKSIAHRFERGHRVRLAISPTYWPWAWPAPEPVRVTVHTGGKSWLGLPARGPNDTTDALRMGTPEWATPDDIERIGQAPGTRQLHRDISNDRHELTYDFDYFGSYARADGSTYRENAQDVYTICQGRPASATIDCKRVIRIEAGGVETRIEAYSRMTSTPTAFLVTSVLDAFEDDIRIQSRVWTNHVPRDLS